MSLIENILSEIFTLNQLDIMMEKKKQVNWTRDEEAKTFTLIYFSKRVCVFVRREFQYPLPDKYAVIWIVLYYIFL